MTLDTTEGKQTIVLKDKILTVVKDRVILSGACNIALGQNVVLPEIDSYGNKHWISCGKLHRTNGPAYINVAGDESWYLNGLRHRDNGPALNCTNGNKAWYKHDKLHRTDGPAIDYANGDKEWWVEGKCHRTDGPAIEKYIDGKLVRLEKWVDDVKISEMTFHTVRLHTKETLSDGTKQWKLKDELHRTDGPALIHPNGDKLWYVLGRLHRTDGPAVEHTDGTKQWYLHGTRHRTDGPAVEHTNGSKQWYYHGELHNENGPSIEMHDNDGRIIKLEKWIYGEHICTLKFECNK